MSENSTPEPSLEGPPLKRSHLFFFLPAVLFLVVAIVVAWFMMSGRDPQAIPSALLDRPAPAFKLPPLTGFDTGFSRADLVGQVTVVNVFASWCTPCLAEHPHIMQLSKTPGVRVFGLNYKNKDEQALAWLKRHGNPYARVGADRDGRVAIEWGVYGVPETFIVDRTGVICFKKVGPVTPQVLSDQILPLVKALRDKDCRTLKAGQG